jgi:primosomal protein N' (replication factor Y) (superfamily II helicase)
MIVQVAVDIPLSDSYDYRVPAHLMKGLVPGVRVLVPLGSRETIGVVVGVSQKAAIDQLKEVMEVVDDKPVFSSRMLEFTKWISRYYVCGWAEVLESAIPRGIKPRIKKSIIVTVDQNLLVDLTEEDRSRLSLLDGKPDHFLKSKACNLSKKDITRWRKSGLFRYRVILENKNPPGISEEWLELLKGGGELPRFRKGCKAEQIVQRLKESSQIRISEIKGSIPNVSTVINKLIREGVTAVKLLPLAGQAKFTDIYDQLFKVLNAEQQFAFEKIQKIIRRKDFQTFYLFGVTGSGKTEVYLHAVKETLLQGRSAIILIPEISLTPQAVSRFKERFGQRVAVLHSGMSDKERSTEWWSIKTGQCDIVIGARSAIFAPLENIGLIVVDEEHDSSYKQQETPFYNARDAAVKLCSDLDAVVILGSATPAVESYHNTEVSKYTLLELTQRANLRPLPQASIINLKEEKRQKGVFYLSSVLVEHLKETYQSGKQSLIFLNRRGFASYLSCKACDLPFLCQNCSIAMTWHKSKRRLVCHHCGNSRSYPDSCDSCGGSSFRMEGIGTQRIEQDLKRLFPEARFLRMDRDSIQKKGSLEKNIELINNQKVDFIVGTQLISKGHDFKHIGMVCVVLADMSLNFPDFRSSERSFQIISQVSGRAGRDEEGEGNTLIQTYNPGHFAIKTAVENSYRAFFEEEIQARRILLNPPFFRLILLKISNTNPDQAALTAARLSDVLKEEEARLGFQLLGPIEAPIQKVNSRYYWQILLKSEKPSGLKRLLLRVLTERRQWKPVGATRVSIDVDPYMLL